MNTSQTVLRDVADLGLHVVAPQFNSQHLVVTLQMEEDYIIDAEWLCREANADTGEIVTAKWDIRVHHNTLGTIYTYSGNTHRIHDIYDEARTHFNGLAADLEEPARNSNPEQR